MKPLDKESQTFTLHDISANRHFGWFLDSDHKTIKQVVTITPYKIRVVGKLAETPSHEKELSDILKPFINREYHKGSANRLLYQATQALTTYINKRVAEQAKAFGGCKNCYGKGYATTHHGNRSFDGNDYHETPKTTHIKYCTCERGNQLVSVVNKRVVEELEKCFYHDESLITNPDTTWIPRYYIEERIKELEAKGVDNEV